ncbi:hypothetical protein [Citromicrobium bathyomarinum]|uniref:hypothetical protein n=1 Tax=Citromicrobium bathyomarinum TaxID=72174 RepID=UPI00315AD8D0
MSSDLVRSDPRAVALRDELQRRWNANTAILELRQNENAAVAPTIFAIGKGGGQGLSTLALTLEFMTGSEALIIEVGGNRCPAFRNRPPERHLHFSSRDPDRIDRALDARFNAPGKVAIIEFEPALYRETIEVAANFEAMLGQSNLMVFYVAGRHEEDPAYRVKAKASGLREVIFCRQAVQSPAGRDAGFVPLPWLHHDIMHSMHAGCANLAEALDKCAGLWTQMEARGRLESFAHAILSGEGR